MKRNPITLLEIMIVIFLIGLIGGVVGYNMKGSMEKGKVFKTKQAQAQLRDILLLEVSLGSSLDEVISHPREAVEHSGLAKDIESLLKDGWNQPFLFEKTSDGLDIEVISEGLKKYESQHAKG